DSFARPFFGGILLDRDLSASARMMLFTFKMLASGKTVLPELGMGQIAEQLAATLPPSAIRLQTRVEGIVEADGRAVGVTLTGGDLVARCRDELAPWFPGKNVARLRHLATYRLRFAQFRQPPGIFAALPASETPTAGLFLAGEYTHSSSINGAMESGERAAK